jgi:hypothetical protein
MSGILVSSLSCVDQTTTLTRNKETEKDETCNDRFSPTAIDWVITKLQASCRVPPHSRTYWYSLDFCHSTNDNEIVIVVAYDTTSITNKNIIETMNSEIMEDVFITMNEANRIKTNSRNRWIYGKLKFAIRVYGTGLSINEYLRERETGLKPKFRIEFVEPTS